MAIFIVRVQLSQEIPARYTRLKDALISVGFTKRIKARDGTDYLLPNGNYLGDSEKNLDQITDIVISIAHKIDKNSRVLVTEAKEKGNSWVGLPKA